jgi:hypothetical protein
MSKHFSILHSVDANVVGGLPHISRECQRDANRSRLVQVQLKDDGFTAHRQPEHLEPLLLKPQAHTSTFTNNPQAPRPPHTRDIPPVVSPASYKYNIAREMYRRALPPRAAWGAAGLLCWSWVCLGGMSTCPRHQTSTETQRLRAW